MKWEVRLNDREGPVLRVFETYAEAKEYSMKFDEDGDTPGFRESSFIKKVSE